jgi:hypothetical protein
MLVGYGLKTANAQTPDLQKNVLREEIEHSQQGDSKTLYSALNENRTLVSLAA